VFVGPALPLPPSQVTTPPPFVTPIVDNNEETFFYKPIGEGARGKWRLAFHAPTTAAEFVSAEEFSHLGDSFSKLYYSVSTTVAYKL